MFLKGDPDTHAQLALGNLDCRILAVTSFASGACIWTNFYTISFSFVLGLARLLDIGARL